MPSLLLRFEIREDCRPARREVERHQYTCSTGSYQRLFFRKMLGVGGMMFMMVFNSLDIAFKPYTFYLKFTIFLRVP